MQALIEFAMQGEVDAVEKYGILGLLYVLLAAVGAFLTRVGFEMNKSIQANTGAVKDLAAQIGKLVDQQAHQAEVIRQQVVASSDRAIAAFKEEISDVREELARSGSGHGRQAS